jgi:hypothetical protein
VSTDIHTGSPAPANASTSSSAPPVAPQTPRWPSPAPATVTSADTVTPQTERLAQYTAAVAAAQSEGMTSALGRQHRLAADMAPLGASYGDEMTLPGVVSDYSKHTAGSDAKSYDPAG